MEILKNIERQPTKKTETIAGVSLIISLALTGCSAENTKASPSPLESVISEASAEMDCMFRKNILEDCDKDGVANYRDVVPWRNDNADDDGDIVPNNRDKWPGLNDLVIDSDKDAIPDYADTFLGNNNQDIDRDGLANGIDPQPFSAPQAKLARKPPATLTQKQLNDALLNMQMGRKQIQEVYGPKADRDYDGIPDNVDSSPTKYTNDRDNDGDPDYYDPKPNDPYTDQRNDPYDPRNDEYWKD